MPMTKTPNMQQLYRGNIGMDTQWMEEHPKSNFSELPEDLYIYAESIRGETFPTDQEDDRKIHSIISSFILSAPPPNWEDDTKSLKLVYDYARLKNIIFNMVYFKYNKYLDEYIELILPATLRLVPHDRNGIISNRYGRDYDPIKILSSMAEDNPQALAALTKLIEKGNASKIFLPSKNIISDVEGCDNNLRKYKETHDYKEDSNDLIYRLIDYCKQSPVVNPATASETFHTLWQMIEDFTMNMTYTGPPPPPGGTGDRKCCARIAGTTQRMLQFMIQFFGDLREKPISRYTSRAIAQLEFLYLGNNDLIKPVIRKILEDIGTDEALSVVTSLSSEY